MGSTHARRGSPWRERRSCLGNPPPSAWPHNYAPAAAATMPDTPFKHLATQAFDEVWEDRAIRFDAPVRQLEARPGERVADSVNSVEDSKGGNGERGALIVSTLRLSWVSHKNSRKNLSIGWATVAHH